MDYTKRSSGDFSKDKSEGKILIMDNPFGKATSEHLLIPVFDMANKYNTQLICLSDVGGDSVYNRFDNIYVLTTEELKLSPGVEIVKSEYSKCSEINSTRFLTELKEVQVSLF